MVSSPLAIIRILYSKAKRPFLQKRGVDSHGSRASLRDELKKAVKMSTTPHAPGHKLGGGVASLPNGLLRALWLINPEYAGAETGQCVNFTRSQKTIKLFSTP